MEAKANAIKEHMYSWLLSEIGEAQAAGVPVRVDGTYYSLQEAEQLKMVMEDSYYMKSYEGDEYGNIVRIDFDHIDSI